MNLDFEIEQQGADGAWSPNFSWGDQHPGGVAGCQARVAVPDLPLKNLRVLARLRTALRLVENRQR